MTGLEQILKQIEEEAAVNAANEIALGVETANNIIAQAQVEADEKCKAIVAKTAQELVASKNRGESAANLYEKKMILRAKQDIITDVINKSNTKLQNLPEDKYFAVLLKLVEKNAISRDGKMLLSTADINRLPLDFEVEVNRRVKDGKLTIVEHMGKIEGGFILSYGDIEINCTFESLFLSAKERLQDKVCEVLFV